MGQNRAYTILFIADYTKASPSWKKYEDTLINNLLNKPASAGWIKYENLPPITVSIIEKAETRQQAFEKLKNGRYDIVLVDNVLDGQPNGAGIINRFRQFQETSMYIPLLAPSQIRGAKKKDGSISDGAGIARLYEKGFYNGVVKQNLNLGKLIELIQSGGRSAEEAFVIYGLNYGQAKLDENITSQNDTVRVTPMESMEKQSVSDSHTASNSNTNMNMLLEVAKLYPDFSLNQVKVFIQDANGNMDRLQIVASLYNTQGHLSDPFGWVRTTLGGKNSGDAETSRDNEGSLPPVSENVTQNASTDTVEKPAMVNAGEVSTDSAVQQKPLNRRQRRAAERERRLNEQMGQQAAADSTVTDITDNTGSIDVPPLSTVSQDVSQTALIENSQKNRNDPLIRELEQLQGADALETRGSQNNALYRPGALHGTVSFAKGTMVVIELGMDIKTIGLRLPDLYGNPVVIPYVKFNSHPGED